MWSTKKKKKLTFTFFFNLSGTLQGAYVMHVQGMTKHIWVKVCKTHTNDQNMINKSNQGNPQSLVLIGVQNNIKMSFGHFIKHLMCTYKTNMWTMHEHE